MCVRSDTLGNRSLGDLCGKSVLCSHIHSSRPGEGMKDTFTYSSNFQDKIYRTKDWRSSHRGRKFP